MKELLFTKSLSVWCPDYTFRKVFSDKLIAFGYKVKTDNMAKFEYLWINEKDPSLENYYKAEQEDQYTYGNGKARWAYGHDDGDIIMRLELPQDWYKALFYATEMVRSQKILRLFEDREDSIFATI